MHRIVNIPHADNTRARLTASVENETAYVKVIDPNEVSPINATGVCEMFIGEHMFEPDKRDCLRMMVAKAIVFAIQRGRDAGYSQAQADIRGALGVKA